MKIGFFGTPDFAAASLARLFEDGYETVFAVTQPDKPAGRGNRLTPPPVKLLAQMKTEVYQPQSLRGPETVRLIRGKAPDVIVVVAYGKLLPPEILGIPPLGCVNIHASLLPKYRGAAPIQRAILAGETATGVTSMYMAEELDAGDVILRRETGIGETETSGGLFARLAVLGAETLSETLRRIADGTAPRVPQDGSEATYAPPIAKSEAAIDASGTVRRVLCHIRGMNPKPAATLDAAGETYKVFSAEASDLSVAAPFADSRGLHIPCADGAVLIREVQPPNGRLMSAADRFRGRAL
jgi:methionyl-tRNA formyltransferase